MEIRRSKQPILLTVMIYYFSDPYVKIYLLYNDQRIAKKKTHVKKRTLNPVFNESFVFELPHLEEGLKNISLEFMLLDWDRVTKNEVILIVIFLLVCMDG